MSNQILKRWEIRNCGKVLNRFGTYVELIDYAATMLTLEGYEVWYDGKFSEDL